MVGFSPEFSQRLGKAGWIGMTWPRTYGGGARSALERYVVTEELLAVAAPVRAHWVADRQSGPVLLRYGTESQRKFFLPRIASGECYFCIGLSEPGAGSDLVSIQTRARKVEDGWIINGQKLWTSNAHRTHYMLGLFRSEAAGKSRHAGLTQLIVDLSSPGITIRPVLNLAREHDFNEVFLDDVFVPDDMLVGEPGEAWRQANAELSYERSGPERWLTTFRVLVALIDAFAGELPEHALADVGRLVAELMALRQMSISVAAMLEAGLTPSVEAAAVKELGTRFEQKVVAVCHALAKSGFIDLQPAGKGRLFALLDQAILWSPGLTIRGGTTEILRSMIARGLGMR